ncbi:MAG: OprO/OprP family phosphate-selective porin [Acidobacteriales bacterium]|nr:OprO/OprP family phosphate-selective porin [Terriglobales bacterium]
MRIALLLCVLLGISAAGVAQEGPAQLSQAEVRALFDRLALLEKRVTELEAKQATQASAAAQPAPAPATSQAGAQALPPAEPSAKSHWPDHGPPMQVQMSEAESFPTLKIRGFANVDFSASDQPLQTRGFSMGQFVLHFASRLSNKISYFGEVSLSAQPALYSVDLERSFVRYDVNDGVKISFGRYHTPINYWNTAFHHGAWLQTTISRPNMIRFGGTFEPVHFVGAQSEGNIPSGGLNLGYNVGIGNGRGSIFSRAADNGDVNGHRAWLVNVYSRPAAFKHLQIGGSYYRDKVTAEVTVSPDGLNYGEWIAAGHLVWTGEAPEFLAEFAHARQRSDLTGRIFDSQGGYAQLAYRLPFWQKRWKPYFRYDYVQSPEGAPVFASAENVRGFTLGTRYDISDFAAIKAEYRNNRDIFSTDRVNSMVMQTAFTF